MGQDWFDEGKQHPEAVWYRKGVRVATLLDNGDFILHTGNVIIKKEDLHIEEKDAILDKGNIYVKVGDISVGTGDVYIKGDLNIRGNIKIEGNIEQNGSHTNIGGFISTVSPAVGLYVGPPFPVPDPPTI